ncbi:MAG TPA: DNA polymerase/3'-5' exonuclease PolX [Bacteroidetes bacterium]|nr:DNA polymerase/3'-5' exonuclease PolX [Bacteroidota bacterium]
MNKKQVAEILDEMGTLFELKGENPFKCRAFHNAARIIEALTTDLGELVETGEIRNVKGIGEHLSQIIHGLVTDGKSQEYDTLKASLPVGLLEMVRIQGLGPKRIKVLYEKLKLKSIAELKLACEQHRLANLEGFGEKTELNILKGIEQLAKTSGKHLYPKAKESAEHIRQSISKLKEVKRCDVAGSLRRKKEVIGDIDIVVSSQVRFRNKIFDAFVSHPDVQEILARGETKSTVLLKAGIQCDVRIVEDREYPFALNYFTGSKEHNVEMRSRARKYGLSLNEYSFTLLEEGGKKTSRAIPTCRDEADIYRVLDLAYIPPELREQMGEIDAALGGKLPTLIEERDLRGTFHCHTTYSDGANSLQEMAAAARERGWEYLGIADHSKIAAYAGGLSDLQVKQQHKEIDKLNSGFKGFRLFKGTEVDILPDGSLDYSDKILSSFDYVVASIHSKFKMTESEATKRIVRALMNRYVTILGHPTGRLLLAREGYPINMIDVITAASDYGKAIEINSHPSRLDLDWRLVKFAREKNVPIFINPDAHNTDGLGDVAYGIGIARKGWLEPKDVVNTWGVKKIDKFFSNLRLRS